MNAVEIEEAISELAGQPFDPAEFPYAFLEAFGNKATTIKRLKTRDSNKSDIEGGVLQRNHIHIAVCDEGAVADTLIKLKESPATTKAKAKFILATDGKEFQAEDVNSGEAIACAYPDFHDHFGLFLPLAGISTVKQIRESAFDIKATGRLNKLYIELLRHNPDWASAERRHDMNHFLARLILCFFAEDTDIFHGDNLFTATVQQMSTGDASDTHEVIGEIFRAMNTKTADRTAEKIKNWANGFPYVNGGLFSGSLDVPKFTKIARSYLIHVGNLDWKQINPDIFGSMIQAVADEDERGALGMHYTPVPNILKVLNPLFLNDLRAQLEEAGDNARKLLNLRKRIARIRVFDPACGSGNFLVIAYKQMREIEFEINKRREESGQSSEIPLTNFRGIELRDFSAEVARLALIIAEYQCDVLYRGQKLALAEFLPLNKDNWITQGNALELDWLSVCHPTEKAVKLRGDDLFSTPLDQSEIDFENEGGETYICGNPPYLGSTWQSKEQKADLEAIFKDFTKTWKSLDYVAGWFMKAAEYGKHTNAASAFVSTNSICQGQQVPILWPLIFKTGHEISFAHTSFKWNNLASYNAGVTVVIVGISNQAGKVRRLFSIGENDETIEKKADYINAYLVSGPNVIVNPKSKTIDGRGLMEWGNKPTDGGNLFLTSDERARLLEKSSEAEKFVKRFMGAQEFIRGQQRYCLWIEDSERQKAEEVTGSAADIYIGSLPFRQMNIQEQDSLDGYGNRLTYAVTASLTDNATFDETRGAISIVDENNNNALGVPDSAQFVVLSHGENENGAITRDGVRIGACPGGQLDSENCNNDETFMKTNARQGFDDEIIHATDALINPWKYVSETSEDVTLNDAVGFGLGNLAELEFESASEVMVLEALSDDAVALSSGGAFMSSFLCDYDDVNCFQSSLIAGQISDGEGIDCPDDEFLIGIDANGVPECSASIRLSCGSGNYLVGISPSGELECSAALAAACPEQSVTRSCGGSDTLGATFSGDNDYVESGECHTFDTFSSTTAESQPSISDLEDYIDSLNAGTRSSGSCDLVRDNYVCNDGSWDTARNHELWNYNGSFPGNPWETGYREAEVTGMPYSQTHSLTGNDCWCREDYRVVLGDCPSGYDGDTVYVQKHRCPQTRGGWTTIYVDDETYCGCTPYTETTTESCSDYYGVPWYAMSGNVEFTYDNTCDAGGDIVTDPSPTVDASNCRCPSRSDGVDTTSCPTGETNNFTNPHNGVTYTDVSEVRIWEWVCPNGEGNPVSGASDGGYWSDTPLTHNEACVCDSDLTDTVTEPCPTGYSGAGREYEREWDCAAGDWEPESDWQLVTDSCQACSWKRPASQPSQGPVGVGNQIGSGSCACGTTDLCYEKGSGSGDTAFDNYSSCSCSP